MAEANARQALNKNARAKRFRERYAEEPAFREKLKARNRAWRNENAELERARTKEWEQSETGKAWRQAYKKSEAYRQQQSEYFKDNPRHRACVRARRARKQNATLALSPVTAEVIAERLALIDGCCYCGKNEPLTLDHVVALNDGGWHIPSNILGACRSCNASKNDRPVEQWFRAQPFFSEDRWQKIQELTQ